MLMKFEKKLMLHDREDAGCSLQVRSGAAGGAARAHQNMGLEIDKEHTPRLLTAHPLRDYAYQFGSAWKYPGQAISQDIMAPSPVGGPTARSSRSRLPLHLIYIILSFAKENSLVMHWRF